MSGSGGRTGSGHQLRHRDSEDPSPNSDTSSTGGTQQQHGTSPLSTSPSSSPSTSKQQHNVSAAAAAAAAAAIATAKLQNSVTNIKVLDQQKLTEHAEALVKRAQKACPAIEARLKYLAELNSGEMIGLEFKIKPLTSLIRKMTSLWSPLMHSIHDIAEMQYDVLRFTMLLPLEDHAQAVTEVIKSLMENENCKDLEVKNYWNCCTYRGINCIFLHQHRGAQTTAATTTGGLKFELQFHTHESFDQKQNKTHILYERFRREENPVLQNLFFADMKSMWDSVNVPRDIMEVGIEKSQPLPEPKQLTPQQKSMIDHIWSLKEKLRGLIAKRRDKLQKIDRFLQSCVTYTVRLHECNIKEYETRFRGTLRVSRKVEEDLRRILKVNISEFLHEVTLPKLVHGTPIDIFISELCNQQHDILTYKVICDDPDVYTERVIGIIDTMLINGFRVGGVNNFWHDQEKHHAISVAFTIPHKHVIVSNALGATSKIATGTEKHHYPLSFRMEFHTKQSYETMVERRAVLQHIEHEMYTHGEAYSKTAADQLARWDPKMIRSWARVAIPKEVVKIAGFCDYSIDLPECDSLMPYETPAQLTKKKRNRLKNVSLLLGGALLGGGGVLAFLYRAKKIGATS